MSMCRGMTPSALLAATIVAAFTVVQCGGSSPSQPTGPGVSGITLASTTAGVGATIQATVSLSAAAPAGGAVVSLTSSNPAVATLQTPLTIAAGATSGAFPIIARATGTTTITASMSGTSQSATLTVSAPALVSISLSAANVLGGESVSGTATLTAPAPAGGAVVALSADPPATVTATVTVPAGATTATFTVLTRVVTATVAATVRGSYGGGSASAVLTIGAPTVATASFGVSGTDSTDTCVMINGGNNLECTFNGTTSTAPGTITAWDWTYTVAKTITQTTTGAVLTNPAASCSFLPPPPLPAGMTSFPLTVTLQIHDSLGNVSSVKVDSGARVLPAGTCGF
jgi:hypothetical protein